MAPVICTITAKFGELVKNLPLNKLILCKSSAYPVSELQICAVINVMSH